MLDYNKHRDVYIVTGKGPRLNAKDALSSITREIYRGKSVLIKPNIGRMAAPGRGITTHPEAIAGVIEALSDGGAGKIVIGESPIVGVNTMKAFEMSGVTDMAKRYGCGLIDMDAGDYIVKEITAGRILADTKICAAVYEYDILLSLPVAKCHMHTGVTLGIKNMKGCLYKREKVRYHQLEYMDGRAFEEKSLDSAISDLATVLLPDITVIDGYTGMEGLGPSAGDAIVSDFAIASANPFAADMAGCLMMGKDPSAVPHLKITADRLGASLLPGEYIIHPPNYGALAVRYKNPPSDISVEFPDVELVDKDSCSACLSTVLLFLKRFKDSLGDYVTDDRSLSLAIGKGVTPEDIKEWTVLVGNCAKLNCLKNTFVKGCPPVASRIFEAITGEEPEVNEPEQG